MKLPSRRCNGVEEVAPEKRPTQAVVPVTKAVDLAGKAVGGSSLEEHRAYVTA